MMDVRCTPLLEKRIAILGEEASKLILPQLCLKSLGEKLFLLLFGISRNPFLAAAAAFTKDCFFTSF